MLRLVGILVTTLVFGSSQVSATEVEVTYTGTITGSDGDNVFGLTGTNLSSGTYSFSASFVADTSLGESVSGFVPDSNGVVGGTLYSVSSPILSASITINGITDTFGAAQAGQLNGLNCGVVSCPVLGYNSRFTTQAIAADNTFMLLDVASPGFGLPYSITNPFNYTVQAGDILDGQFADPTAGTNLSLFATTITLTDLTTPLPAALPLFATGLGGLGLLGWRRKRKAQAVA
jgi:hypothetical protein